METPPPTTPGAGWTAPPQPSGPAPGIAFAPHGARLVAYIIDSIIVSVVVTVGQKTVARSRPNWARPRPPRAMPAG